MPRLARWYAWFCWLPVALMGVVLDAAWRTEGFAAVAVAGLLVIPLYFSGFLVLAGLGLMFLERCARRSVSLSLASATLISAVPLLLLAWRLIFPIPSLAPAREPVIWAFRCQSPGESAPSWSATALPGVSCSREALIPPGLVVWRCRSPQGNVKHSLDPLLHHECSHLMVEIPFESLHVVRVCWEEGRETRFYEGPGGGGNCQETIWIPGMTLE